MSYAPGSDFTRRIRYSSPSTSQSNDLPSCRALISASSSFIADAIQRASRCSTRPLSAVTRPPPPRVACSSPSSPRSNVAGPRFETRISLLSAIPQAPEDPEPVAQEPGGQEVLADVLLAGAAELLAELGLLQDAQRAVGAGVGVRHEEAGPAVLHLERDATDVAADERARLPQRLGHGEAEALARGLLDQHLRLRLEGVHLDRAHVVQVVEDLDVGVPVRVF